MEYEPTAVESQAGQPLNAEEDSDELSLGGGALVGPPESVDDSADQVLPTGKPAELVAAGEPAGAGDDADGVEGEVGIRVGLEVERLSVDGFVGVGGVGAAVKSERQAFQVSESVDGGDGGLASGAGDSAEGRESASVEGDMGKAGAADGSGVADGVGLVDGVGELVLAVDGSVGEI